MIRNPYRKRPRSALPSEPLLLLPALPSNVVGTNKKATYSMPVMAAGRSGGAGSGEASALVISAADKAGMEGIDRAAIDAIILKESGNSLFMQQQRRRDDKVNGRIAAFREKFTKMQEQQSQKNSNQ